MSEESFGNLLEITKSPSFDAFQCIHQLKLHGSNIGVHHYLVNRLQSFSYSEIEFFIPQLVQILVNFETESMALSDFLLHYSKKYHHFCLLTFWNLQAYVFELKNDPNSYPFHIVRGFINELQNIMFNQDSAAESITKHEFRENLPPSLVLCGSVVAALGMPNIQRYNKPLIISQGKQQKTFLFKLANFHKSLTKNLTLKNRGKPLEEEHDDSDSSDKRPTYSSTSKRKSESNLSPRPSKLTDSIFDGLEDDRNYNSDYSLERTMKVSTKIVSKKTSSSQRSKPRNQQWNASEILKNSPAVKHGHISHSMPDLSANREPSLDEMTITPIASDSSSTSLASLDVHESKSFSSRSVPMLYDQKVKFLHVNYFKKETEFMMVLQNISTRLSQVPKEARLTSLRAELSIINNTLLPAEIDIPQLLPVSSQQNKKFHKIVKVNVNEACVLNSAERVPFLLLIEYLSEETDFDPLSDINRNIILNKLANEFISSSGRRGAKTSTLTGSSRNSTESNNIVEEARAALEETDLGDMSVVAISNEQSFITNHLSSKQSEEMSTNLTLSLDIEGIRLDESSSLTVEQGKGISSDFLSSGISTRDLSTQMRIAAVMLQQLEKSGQANSEQSASIRARIIESMKGLQDKFENIDYQQIKELKDVHVGDNSSDAGERKLENDFKLGEDWTTKKSRIRKASAHGHLKNWDLCSVIAKNGDDLPQEAFACQLISLISNLWKSHKVGVWTKNMKIIVTSANTGLVETINNAMSIHSIKKSLTEISVSSGQNPKGRVASVHDYFQKVYGDTNSSKYRKAQSNFAKSLAAYSIICYVLQIKDRHNGNIMLDNEGHIIHIDFGFLLSNSPGSVGFEAAPFKLTFEYIEVLGGIESPAYNMFTDLCKKSFRVLRQNCDQLINMVDLMQKDSSLPCFKNGAQTSVLLKQRLQTEMSDDECDSYVESILIGKSVGSVYTRLYDQFQLITQGIYS